MYRVIDDASSNQIIAWTNTGWNVKSRIEWGNQAEVPASPNTCVYVYDTANHWMASSSISLNDMSHASNELSQFNNNVASRQRLSESCALQICKAADMGASSSHIDSRKALLTGMFLAIVSRDYGLVKKGLISPVGHWVTILYRLRNASLLTRVAFNPSGPNKLNSIQVKSWIASIVDIDLTSVGPINHSILAAGGVNIGEWG
jgi:hypothetical protein